MAYQLSAKARDDILAVAEYIVAETGSDAIAQRALQIANPTVVAKAERAIDLLAAETQGAAASGQIAPLLAQLDRIPDRADAVDPLEWDANGLPT
jgi:antitoxin VapB